MPIFANPIKTPDVYVQEIAMFPPSVAEVGTAIPAFIGYTEKAERKGVTLTLKPTKIYSLKEYEDYFGMPHADEIKLELNSDTAADGKTKVYSVKSVTEPTVKYLLYYSVKMFFDNGGAQCYIVSVGGYKDTATIDLQGDNASFGLQDGLEATQLEDEPTLIVIPEAVKMTETDYQTLVGKVLQQCGKLGDRFGIFDIPDGDKVDPLDSDGLKAKRGFFPMQDLKYGAAYYPFLKTTMNFYVNPSEDNVKVTIGAGAAKFLKDMPADSTTAYNLAKAILKDHYLVMPPSGAIAGIYAAVDASRGVWKAPANVSIAGVIEPIVKIDNLKQADYNIDVDGGKSINVLRSFAGKGVMVWGARTLAGNDNEWRYISVRRFFNMVEESVMKSTYFAVFEPNSAPTWVKVRGMIENYLTDKWRDGALAGATPKDAFFVKCGLGTTMNPQDILNGFMNVEIGMAVVRPAEFIILKFSHKLQTS